MYTSLIRSKLDYGCQAYNCTSKMLLNKLHTIQATALRIPTRAFRGTQNFGLKVECNIMPLQKCRDKLQLKYWACSSMHGENLPINSMTKPHAIYETLHNRLSGKVPYNISVQDMIQKHDLTNIKIQPINYRKKHNVSCIKPKSVLNTGKRLDLLPSYQEIYPRQK